nr:subtilisin-like protease sbt4.15 [Quercus suber]
MVSVFPSKRRKLHTTRSWDFLGMPQSVKRNHQIESNVIVGVLDTGIYIDAPSFDDKGFGPPPSKWKGTCQVRGNFTGCNNKVTGARFYNHASTTPHPNPSPIDEEGHGSHTSSTIAGASIARASLYGLAKGTARGGVPSARIAMLCDEGSLDANKVKGKIVLCKEGLIQDYIKEIGGLGAIVSLQQQSNTGFTYTIPAAFIDTNVGDKIEKYVNSTRAPQAVIYKSKAIHNATTPFVASFSSRGPNTISSTIIKPDIVAPGIDILAAYSKLSSVTGDLEDNRFDVYNIIFGTSMACPHVAATAAYVKSFHPNWSPATIKSALMTTASQLKIKDVQAELAYGAGQIDPVKALHPGLIYDMSKSDYIRFLCNERYTGTALKVLTEENTNCSSIPDIGGHDALNYPSMYLQLNSANSSISAIFHRTVTNVGLEKAIYKAIVKAPATLKVTVVPKELAFSHLYEKKSFTVVMKGPPLKNITSVSASLEWSDAKHRVRSPILIFLGI